MVVACFGVVKVIVGRVCVVDGSGGSQRQRGLASVHLPCHELGEGAVRIFAQHAVGTLLCYFAVGG